MSYDKVTAVRNFSPFPATERIQHEASVMPDENWQRFASMVARAEDDSQEEKGILSGLVRGVDASRDYVDGALARVGQNADAASTLDAMRALSRYDLQTLMLSKISTKVTQAVDRLVNLQ